MPLAPPQSAAPSLRRFAWTCLRFAIGIGLLVYLAKSGVIDLATLRRLSSSWPISFVAVALMGVDVLMMSLRLSWLLQPHGLHLPLGKSLQLTFVSFFFTTFLPGSSGGVLSKLFYAAKENQGRRTEIATVVVFDRAVGLFSLLLLSLVFVPIFPRLVWSVVELRLLVLTVVILTIGLLAALAVIMLDRSWAHRLLRRALRSLRWKDLPSRVIGAIGIYRGSPGTLFAALAVSLLANFSVVCVAALALYALTPSSFSFRVLLVAPMGYIANSLPLTPGGLGVGEGAFNSLFRLTGLGGGADVLLSWRIWSLPISIVGLACYLRGFGRSVHGRESTNIAHSGTSDRAR
jgi:uncharacterized protein (TIRG00374 family)